MHYESRGETLKFRCFLSLNLLNNERSLGPVVQSIVSLTGSLEVNSLSVLGLYNEIH